MQLVFISVIGLAIIGTFPLIVIWSEINYQGLIPAASSFAFAIAYLLGIGFIIIDTVVYWRKRDTERRILLLTFIPVLLMMNAISISAIFDSRADWRNQNNLRQYGNTTSAEIINLREQKWSKGTSYYVKYRFSGLNKTTNKLSIFEKEQSVTIGLYERLQIGSLVTIIYDPNNPDDSDIKDNDILWDTTITRILVNAMTLFFLFPVFSMDIWTRLFIGRTYRVQKAA